MAKKRNIYDMMRAAIAENPRNSDHGIAVRVLRELKVAAEASNIIAPALASVVASVRRAESRIIERGAFSKSSSNGDDDEPTKVALDARGNRTVLLEETFPLGDGTRVSWGEATVKQHEQRLVMLARLRQGLDFTMGQHRAAIRLIQDHRVKCLGNIKWEEAGVVRGG